MISITYPNLIRQCLLLLLITSIYSCQAGTPNVTALSSTVKGFSLKQKIQYVKSKSNFNYFAIKGQCHQTIKSVEVSFDQGQSYQMINPGTNQYSQINCSSDGTFLIQINPSILGFPVQIPTTSKYLDLFVRGQGLMGQTTSLPFRLEILPRTNQITAGSVRTVASSSVNGVSYTIKGRIISSSEKPLQQNGYQIKGSIVVR